MSLPPGFIDELRDRVSLAQVIGRKLTWDRKSNAARGDYWAPCPFHQEKSASFHVDDARGYYYCFGCHAKGDVVTFLRETENLGFMEAVERLAGIAGMTMPARDPEAAKRAEKRNGLVEAMEAAVQFYRMNLHGARAIEARSYLDRRGLTAGTQTRFDLGYAPDSRTALIEHLKGKGFAVEKIVEAGLAGVPREGGAPYDRFRGRIMFPIRDAQGRAIAFGARALGPGQEPKYLNSPETPLFDKGRGLYNIGPARAAAGKAGTILVVEGYMDVIALAQAGFENAVAPLGTAITETQLRTFWRMTPEPLVMLDGDAAGLRAGQRLIDLALPLLGGGQSLRFVILPPGQDPDDVLRDGGAAAMTALIGASRPLLDLLWSRETEGAVLDSPERRAALDARLRAHLGRIADPGLRAHYEAEIRTRRAELFAPRRDGAAAGRRTGGTRKAAPPRRGRAPAGGPVASTRASLLARGEAAIAEARVRESAILYGCLNHPEIALAQEERLGRADFHCADLAEIRDALLSALLSILNGESRAESVATLVARRLGRDVLADLDCLGQVRANPHLRADADPEKAALAVEEELIRQAALTGWLAETRDAAAGLSRDTVDWIGPRLRRAAEAAHEAGIRPLAGENADLGIEREEFASTLASVEEQQRAHRNRKRKS
ncbi:DNA primase [Amaricoccus solimangrovi]|uniref:DNA primase n=1 Tax=Amaricoccus solimangrovi TaxID=2589815 RepID=A0A501WV83_9RHOB|nr:DNA primase [Amaricoccus solimangrovi]TPE52215.1 DNA primase [Amaricoccus solimangrovi]